MNSPFLIGNLWDVTDKDIDKMTKKIIESIIQNKSINNICDIINEARRYINSLIRLYIN